MIGAARGSRVVAARSRAANLAASCKDQKKEMVPHEEYVRSVQLKRGLATTPHDTELCTWTFTHPEWHPSCCICPSTRTEGCQLAPAPTIVMRESKSARPSTHPVSNPWVMQASCEQHSRIRDARLDIVHRRVRFDGLVVRSYIGIAPLLPLPRRQGNARVRHGRQHIHERNASNGAVEEVGRHVQDRPDQQAPRRAPFDGQLRWGGHATRHQRPPTGDKVGKSERLGAKLGRLVPSATHLAAAPHVGHHKHHAAVEQGQQSGRKGRVNGYLIRPIPIPTNQAACTQPRPHTVAQEDSQSDRSGAAHSQPTQPRSSR